MKKDENLPEFEEWLSEQTSHGVFMGGYTPEEEAAARAAWKASRAAIVIALPEEDDVGDTAPRLVMDSEEVRQAIKLVGVSFC